MTNIDRGHSINALAASDPNPKPFDPSGLRGGLGERLLRALANDFSRHGARAVSLLRRKRRQDYLKLIAALMPKEFRIRQVELPDMTDEELAKSLAAIKAMIALQEKAAALSHDLSVSTPQE
jgi:hypothetical protein